MTYLVRAYVNQINALVKKHKIYQYDKISKRGYLLIINPFDWGHNVPATNYSMDALVSLHFRSRSRWNRLCSSFVAHLSDLSMLVSFLKVNGVRCLGKVWSIITIVSRLWQIFFQKVSYNSFCCNWSHTRLPASLGFCRISFSISWTIYYHASFCSSIYIFFTILWVYLISIKICLRIWSMWQFVLFCFFDTVLLGNVFLVCSCCCFWHICGFFW